MTRRLLQILPLLLLLTAATCLAQPAQAAQLASVTGQADADEVTEAGEFKLSEQTEVQVSYDVKKLDDACAIQVSVYRKQNGRWIMVNTVLNATASSKGSRTLSLSKGEYRIQVVATQTKFDISVEK